jgi:hypothetical protein
VPCALCFGLGAVGFGHRVMQINIIRDVKCKYKYLLGCLNICLSI